MQDLYKKPQPTFPEWLSNFFLGTIATIILFTAIDIVVHDGYVVDDIADCYFQENMSDRCLGLYKIHECEIGDQLCLGQNYWHLLTAVVQVTGGLLLVGRIVAGKFGGAKTNPMLIIVGIMWYVSAVILFYTGWLDTLYYWLRGDMVPLTLPWLDSVGLFSLVQELGITKSVDNTDLYLLNVLGVIIYIGMWGFMVHHHRKKTWQRLHLI